MVNQPGPGCTELTKLSSKRADSAHATHCEAFRFEGSAIHTHANAV